VYGHGLLEKIENKERDPNFNKKKKNKKDWETNYVGGV